MKLKFDLEFSIMNLIKWVEFSNKYKLASDL